MSLVVNMRISGTPKNVGKKSTAWQLTGINLLGNVTMGITELVPDDALPGNTHDYLEVFYVVSGTGSLISHGERSRLSPGDLAVIPPGEEHSVENSSTENLIMLYMALRDL
ncbi:MAG: cupin domain-containing protein [Candidatus Fermentithermobacillus carboniphilus]|uniref:Cupin domain-containing protein n=1 Tax=Candidatus Fermentithermobacillus carboniphilus TaxID=3085328 RepID=A0AAT9LDZ6_9FIRM|nr:MAG: cupin domain-containing protein [Candidatus Fermentithermobacillus carboniphilus]